METPFLFDCNRLINKKTTVFRRQAFVNCGRHLSLYKSFECIPDEVWQVLEASSVEFQKAWKDELAAEALVASLNPLGTGRHFRYTIDPAATPFGPNGPTYRTLQGQRIALALFPLANELRPESVPEVGRLWLVDQPIEGIKSNLVGLDGLDVICDELPPGWMFFLDVSSWPDNARLMPSGRSWLLAAKLALKMLYENQKLFELATGWIASGSVEDQEIREVGIGNKLDLDAAGRRWLLPLANRHEIEAGIYGQNRYLCVYGFHLAEACVIIRGS